jgi:hypothetical protein
MSLDKSDRPVRKPSSVGAPPRSAPRKRPPLGMPAGSVRAALTLIIIAVVAVRLAEGKAPPLLWSETLFIALAHYFTSRRLVELPADVMDRLEEAGEIERDANPLYLPRHSIRVLILAVFIGLSVYLFQEGKLLNSPAISVLGVVLAYLLGNLFRGAAQWIARLLKRPIPAWWDDLKAAAVLLAIASAALVEVFQRQDIAPSDFEHAALGLVLYYFGSR